MMPWWVFGNSSLYERGQSGTLFPNITERFAGVDVAVVMLGDATYPLLPWLMKPYPENQQTTPAQITFNNRLSKAWMTVERALGRLEGRWRCLMKSYDCHINNINTIISAFCVLHWSLLFSLSALINLVPSSSRQLFSEKKLWQTHCTLPAQHQTAQTQLETSWWT